MELLAIGLFCLAPFALFGVGVWVGMMVGKGRLRSPLSPTETTSRPGKRHANGAVWEP
jgi:hypothetical protein